MPLSTEAHDTFPQQCLYFLPLPQEQGKFLSRPFITGARITGLFASTVLAWRMKSRGELTGNHLLRKKVLATLATAPEIGSICPQTFVAANRITFIGSRSTRLGFPIVSIYRAMASSAVSAGAPLPSQSRIA